MMEASFLREIGAESSLLYAVCMAVALFTLVAVLFAAVAVVRRIQNQRKFRDRSRLERTWEVLLLEIMADEAPPPLLWQLVEPRDRLFFVEFLLRHAFVVKGDARERIIELARPYLGSFRGFVRHRDPMIRAQAIHVLGVLGMEGRPDTIASALDDPSPVVAMAAARALSVCGNPDYARRVLGARHRFQDWGTSFTASLLTAVGTPIVPDLLAILSDEDEPVHQRVVAAESLRWLGIGDAAEPAHRLLRRPVDPELAAAALRILRRVGRPDHANAVRMLCYSPHEVVRLHALSALASIGSPDDAPVLAVAMADPSRWIVIRAARGLLELGAHDTLRRVAQSDHKHAPLARQILSERG